MRSPAGAAACFLCCSLRALRRAALPPAFRIDSSRLARALPSSGTTSRQGSLTASSVLPPSALGSDRSAMVVS
uniref:Putative secreted protein n=1 Tax=Ixodes ricinus TaxID=34613 RepID=A0A6B0U126_IXORI